MEPIFTVGIPQLRKNYPSLFKAGIGDDFFIVEEDGQSTLKGQSLLEILKGPLRFDGLFFFFCSRGEFDVDINLQTFSIGPGSLAFNIPGNIFRIPEESLEKTKDIRFECFGISRDFLSGIRLDFNNSLEEAMKVVAQPCVTLNPSQIELAADYSRLAKKILTSPIRDKKEVLGTLISSFSRMLLDVWRQGMDTILSSRQAQASVRAQDIFERFLALVSENHTHERGLAFYADKLCLTPKYLSKLIKQISGRSAAEWIDAYVILEAKNMLRFSEIPIKGIVYRLHFPNQSVFYKFFKMHTGMTPSAYRSS